MWLISALHWTARDVVDQLEDRFAITGPPLVMGQSWLRDAASLAEEHRLSFYDASWAAAAVALGIALVSADRRLVAAGLAESPSAIAARLKLDH